MKTFPPVALMHKVSVLFLIVVVLALIPQSFGQPVPPASFSFFRQILIDHRQVSNTDQTDFPVLISGTFAYLATVGSGGQLQNSSGFDIVFTSDAAGQSQLDHEIDSYDPTTGKAAFWVRIPLLSHTVDTTIYMWYGNSAVTTSQENKPGVWRNGYAGVWHFGGSSLSTNDSSANLNNATNHGVVGVAGKFGEAGSFDGSGNTYFRVPSNSSFKPASTLTLEAWVNLNGPTSWSKVFSLDHQGNGTWNSPFVSYSLNLLNNTTDPGMGVAVGGNNLGAYGGISLATGQWAHMVGTYDGNQFTVYANGTQVAVVAQTGPIDYGTSQDLTIGTRSPYTPGEAVNGLVDEARISTVARSADWIATEYNNQNTPSSFAVLCGQVVSGAQPPPCSLQNPPSTFSFVRQFEIDHRHVANSDQTDFPVLIPSTIPDLATVANGGAVQNASGYDIVFTSDSAGQNQLDHEIDSYDPVTGNAAFWVRIPTLSHTADTTVYMWYGNTSVLVSQENKPGVWRNGYAAVYHLGGGGTNASGIDSVGRNNGSVFGVSPIPGMIGGSGQFTGSSSSYIALPNSSTLKPTTALTLEGWVNPTSAGSWNKVFSLDYNANGSWALPTVSYALSTNGSTASPSMQLTVNNQLQVLGASGSLSFGAWTHLVGTYDGAVMRLYLNGLQDPNTLSAAGTIGYGTSKEVVIGKDSLYASPVEPWNGLLDELRISSVARSADWIATEYNNQSSPSSFVVMCGQTGSVIQPPSCALPVPPSSFGFSRAVVISHGKVPNTDQTDFPVLISGVFPYLANAANNGQVQNLNGYDIAFTSDAAGQNQLDHEIDYYDPLTGTASFWVRIPTLSHATDTTIYMWYGSSAVLASQENKTGVWRNGYAGVWHFSNANRVSALDSTSNANNGSINGTPSVVGGQIGWAAKFTNNSDDIAIRSISLQ